MPKAIPESEIEETPVVYDMDVGVYGDTPPSSKIATGQSPTPIITWTNRRRMAWISLITFLVVGVYLIVFAPHDRLEAVETVYYYLVLGCGMVIAAYVGFTSLPYIGKGK